MHIHARALKKTRDDTIRNGKGRGQKLLNGHGNGYGHGQRAGGRRSAAAPMAGGCACQKTVSKKKKKSQTVLLYV